MTEVSADSKFVAHDGTASMRQTKWTGDTTIYVDELDYENLGDYIHEINEAEIYQLLFCDFDIEPENYPIILSPSHYHMLEDKDGCLNIESVVHLISPYGFNCLIGRKNEPKW